jgi:hypothetical protein
LAVSEQSSAMTRCARILSKLSPSDRGPVFRWLASLTEQHFAEEQKKEQKVLVTSTNPTGEVATEDWADDVWGGESGKT